MPSSCIQQKFQLMEWNKISTNHLFPPRIELRTFSVLGRRDDHYTMETVRGDVNKIYDIQRNLSRIS